MKKLLFTIIISSLLIPSVLLSEPIKIGGIYTLSGFGAAGGEAELNGTR